MLFYHVLEGCQLCQNHWCSLKQTKKKKAWCPWVCVLTRPWIWLTFSMKNNSALHHLKMSFVSECDISTLIYHFITHSLKGQQRKLYFAFQLTGMSFKVLMMCIQHWKQDSVLGLSWPVTAKCWLQIYTEAKDWKAQLDNLSVSRKGACCLSLTQSLLCHSLLWLRFVLTVCSPCLHLE